MKITKREREKEKRREKESDLDAILKIRLPREG